MSLVLFEMMMASVPAPSAPLRDTWASMTFTPLALAASSNPGVLSHSEMLRPKTEPIKIERFAS